MQILWGRNWRVYRLDKFFLTLVAEKIAPGPHPEQRDITWYPCIGSKIFPYAGWRLSYRDSAWDTLESLGKMYHLYCRAFRNKWKWSPESVDRLPIDRILRIFNELQEDTEKNPNQVDEDDLE